METIEPIELELQKLREKIEEILKNNVIISFSSNYLVDIVIITSKLFIYKREKDLRFREDGLLDRTIPLICKQIKFNCEVWYICSLNYKDMVINNSSIAQIIIEKKFKEKTLDGLYKEIK